MSLYAFDTDILTLYQSGHATGLRNAASRPPNELAITVISIEKQLSGWYRRLRQAR